MADAIESPVDQFRWPVGPDADRGLREVLSVVTGVLSGGEGRRKSGAARQEAVRIYSEIVGAMVLSRAVAAADPALSLEIVDTSRKALS